MARRELLGFRASAAFTELVDGIADNRSAVIRALALLGAERVGRLDLCAAEQDVYEAFKDRLPGDINSALFGLVAQLEHASRDRSRGSDSSEQPSADRITTMPQNSSVTPIAHQDDMHEDDPFASVGFSFDE